MDPPGTRNALLLGLGLGMMAGWGLTWDAIDLRWQLILWGPVFVLLAIVQMWGRRRRVSKEVPA